MDQDAQVLRHGWPADRRELRGDLTRCDLAVAGEQEDPATGGVGDGDEVIERLEPLVGRWRSSGRTVDGVQIAGTDAYEWFPGGGFLVHHVDVQMGEDRVQALEMIGDPDPTDGGRLRMRAFDNQGGYAEMRASVDEAGIWTFIADTTRTTLTVDSDGKTMAAKWERSLDGATWVDWMDMEFAREA